MNGIINVNKPNGISSNAVLTKIKRQFHISKIGHLGTLDPMATGVLPVTIGKATRLFDYFLKKDKTYLATFTFGKETDTLDAEGQVIKQSTVLPKKEQIEEVLIEFLGEINQIPPQYSAKNVNGKRAYELARQNVSFTLSAKKVHIFEYTLQEQLNDSTFTFFIHCSSGTYIRSLVRDLASRLNTVGYMSALVRLSSGQFKLVDSVNLDKLLYKNLEEHIISLKTILNNFEVVNLDDNYYKDLINGVKIPYKKEGEFLLYCKNELFGIARVEEGILKVKVYLKA